MKMFSETDESLRNTSKNRFKTVDSNLCQRVKDIAAHTNWPATTWQTEEQLVGGLAPFSKLFLTIAAGNPPPKKKKKKKLKPGRRPCCQVAGWVRWEK